MISDVLLGTTIESAIIPCTTSAEMQLIISIGFINYQTFPLTLSTAWYLLLSLLHRRNKSVLKKVMRSFHFFLPCVFNHYGPMGMTSKECAGTVGKLA